MRRPWLFLRSEFAEGTEEESERGAGGDGGRGGAGEGKLRIAWIPYVTYSARSPRARARVRERREVTQYHITLVAWRTSK